MSTSSSVVPPVGRPIVVCVHGGAGYIPDAAREKAEEGVRKAVEAGFGEVAFGGTALAAVEAAVQVLESLPYFNAGTGSVLTEAGTIEQDALICDGKTLDAAAVTMISQVRFPIVAARKLLETGPHRILGGAGAEAFAGRVGCEMVSPTFHITDARREQLAATLAERKARGADIVLSRLQDPAAAVASAAATGETKEAVHAAFAAAGAGSTTAVAASSAPTAAAPAPECDAGDHDTVGAVALDAFGNVAAATSTGGLMGKWVGRIGDTPLHGAGGYADNDSGACSTTGTGEFIIRALLAKSTCDAYDRVRGTSVAAGTAATAATASATSATASSAADAAPAVGVAGRAAVAALQRMKTRLGGPGCGLIFVAPDGDVGVAHSSARMNYAVARGSFTGVGDAATYEPAISVGIEAPAEVGGVHVLPQ